MWKLDLNDARSNPEEDGGSFIFDLICLNDGRRTDMRLSSAVGWWLEALVWEAYRRVGGLSNVTVIPTRRVLQLFTEVKLDATAD